MSHLEPRAPQPAMPLTACGTMPGLEGIVPLGPCTSHGERAALRRRPSQRLDPAGLPPGWDAIADHSGPGRQARVGRRAADILLALALLAGTLPVMLLAALLVRLSGAGPVLYRQQRVGLGGCPFVLLKFRSMAVDAEAHDAPVWAAQDDPRATKAGAILRRFRIDELPQLFNVLRGDMAMIGPRPERPHFVAGLERAIPFYAERHRAKPGITGWAQVNYPYGASVEDAREKLSYDLYYTNCPLL